MNNDNSQRLSPQSESGENEIGSLLEEASAFARGVLESIQALAGTEACKGVQIARLKDWAISHNCWISNNAVLGSFSDRGSENEVYASDDSTQVYKLFPDCAYELVGFAENRDGNTCAVLRQSFIVSEREATQQEIDEELERLGFRKEDDGFFTNGDFDIFDAVPNNVLKGQDEHLYFIDTIIFKSGTGGLNTYRSLSPRCSSE